MALRNCNERSALSCVTLALIAGAILGVIAAFLHITGVITVTPVFLWVAFVVAVVYLKVLVIAAAAGRNTVSGDCRCSVLNTILAGILGTVLLSVILLAVGIVATSVLSAILVGLLVLSFTLILAGTACLVRCLSDCES